MSDKDTGGPAFGQVVELRCVHVDPNGATEWEPEAMLHGALTVRDYFAAKAMQAAITGHITHFGHDNYWNPKDIAAYADEVADAMLAERAK